MTQLDLQQRLEQAEAERRTGRIGVLHVSGIEVTMSDHPYDKTLPLSQQP